MERDSARLQESPPVTAIAADPEKYINALSAIFITLRVLFRACIAKSILLLFNQYKARRQSSSEIMEYQMTTEKRGCRSIGSRFQKRKGSGRTKVIIKRLRAQMAEIGEQQKRVRKGQMEIRERFKEIDFDCDQLKKETFLISKQAARNQQRLNLMFKIVKAREENNFSEDDKLTQSLRECMKHDMENNL